MGSGKEENRPKQCGVSAMELRYCRSHQGMGEGSNIEAINLLQEEVNVLIELEDLKWRQKSKQEWLLHCDKNSKFFHACVNQHRKC